VLPDRLGGARRRPRLCGLISFAHHHRLGVADAIRAAESAACRAAVEMPHRIA
jgi:hypothetical protein